MQMRPAPFSSLYSVEKSNTIEPSAYLFMTWPRPPPPRPPRPPRPSAVPPAGAALACAGFGAAPFQWPLKSGWPSAVVGVVLPSTEQPKQGAFEAAAVDCVWVLLQPATARRPISIAPATAVATL